jgi:hypothetical protein
MENKSIKQQRMDFNMDEVNYLIHTSEWTTVEYFETDNYSYITIRKPKNVDKNDENDRKLESYS